MNRDEEIINSFNIESDDIHLEEGSFDGETDEERKDRKERATTARKRAHKKDIENRNKNGILTLKTMKFEPPKTKK